MNEAESPHQETREAPEGAFLQVHPSVHSLYFSNAKEGSVRQTIIFRGGGTTSRSKRRSEIYSLNIKILYFLGDVDS